MSTAMRIPAHVWPVWLPRAVARAELRALKAQTQSALLKQPLPPILFSASFQSPLSRPIDSNSTSSNWAFKPPSQLKSLQQIRTLSTSRIPRPTKTTNQVRAFSNSPTSPPQLQPEHTNGTPPPLWTPPTNISSRPVTIVGAGVLGRRLAVIWASTGSPVNLYDISPSALKSATIYVADTLSTYCSEQDTHPGHVRFTTDLVDAVSNSWMVIEAVPEEIEVKISVLGRIDRSAPKDAIIATNSSSFKSRELVSEVKGRERVLNTLYYIPPGNKCVELMSCGYTSPSIFPFLVANMRDVGLMPMVVGNESTGMIFPRIWAAMKRETLRELQEGVASAEEVDELFKDFFGAEKGICEKMDEVGLDTVVKVERKFLEDKETRDETRLWREHKHLNWLEREFVEKGRLGDKSGGGLLARNEEVVGQEKKKEEKKIQDLDDELPAQKTWQIHAVDLSGL